MNKNAMNPARPVFDALVRIFSIKNFVFLSLFISMDFHLNLLQQRSIYRWIKINQIQSLISMSVVLSPLFVEYHSLYLHRHQTMFNQNITIIHLFNPIGFIRKKFKIVSVGFPFLSSMFGDLMKLTLEVGHLISILM